MLTGSRDVLFLILYTKNVRSSVPLGGGRVQMVVRLVKNGWRPKGTPANCTGPNGNPMRACRCDLMGTPCAKWDARGRAHCHRGETVSKHVAISSTISVGKAAIILNRFICNILNSVLVGENVVQGVWASKFRLDCWQLLMSF